MSKHYSQEMKLEAVKLFEAGKTHREIRDGLQGFRTSGVVLEKGQELRVVKRKAARQLAHNARNYELLTAENGLLYFVVRNARKEVIVRSNMYPDSECMGQAINIVKGTTRGARLEDLT